MKKRVIIIISIILVVLLTVDILAGNYLVSYAIQRKEKPLSEIVPTPTTESDAEKLIRENAEALSAEIDQWMEEVTPEKLEITSDDGLKLVADFYPQESNPDHRYAILVHGYTGNRGNMKGFGVRYAGRGYELLMPDLRAHGESEGGYIGMGWPDRRDILRWIDVIIDRDPEAKIVLHGVSMGGATVMMTSGEELPSNVIAIVEDCGYTSVWDIFSDEVKYIFHIPTFPVLDTASIISGFRAGYNFKEASAVKQVAKAQVPIFFTHGSEDNFVHTEMIYEVYEACPTDKEIYVAEGAGHGQALYIDPEKYFGLIFAFLEKYE